MIEDLLIKLENFARDVLDFFTEEHEKEETHSSQCSEILLRDMPHPDLFFYLNGVVPIKNLYELKEVMNSIDEDTFGYHVDEKGNGFAEWVEKAVGDKMLAEKMHAAPSLKRMQNAVNVRVEWLQSRKQ
ncbi:MAG: hypothetical protein ABIA76_04730 [Candidatus Diapherotrites archaeon]